MGTLRNDNILTLSDGRQLGYAEYGDPKGHPVFMFHGNPGSRLSFGLIPGSPFLPEIHIVAPDRPGYGLTDFKKNALEHWPDDVAELADHLGIEKFALFAPSGGGPFALACAWKIPDRISTMGIFGSVGPNEPEATKGVIRSYEDFPELAKFPYFFAYHILLSPYSFNQDWSGTRVSNTSFICTNIQRCPVLGISYSWEFGNFPAIYFDMFPTRTSGSACQTCTFIDISSSGMGHLAGIVTS